MGVCSARGERRDSVDHGCAYTQGKKKRVLGHGNWDTAELSAARRGNGMCCALVEAEEGTRERWGGVGGWMWKRRSFIKD